ncbi:MAG: PIN domain-containing protein [Gammaproteobacteria bacterium]|nr:PIN domain-containing protein [Gammaproteobacteria bacterium]
MVLADTGYWLALANRRDRWHEAAVGVTRGLDEQLVTTWPVMTETCHLLLARLGSTSERRFLEQVEANVDVYEIGVGRVPEIRALMVKSEDLPMDLADASLVLAADELGTARILSTDVRDFRAYRWRGREPVDNLLTEH